MSVLRFASQHSRPLSYALSILAHVIWGFLPLYWKLLDGIDPLSILAYRVLFSCLLSWIAVLIFQVIRQVKVSSSIAEPRNEQKKLKGQTRGIQRRTLGLTLIAALLMALNWYTFIWAVVRGFTLDVSLGYFLVPMVNLFTGIIMFKERPSFIKRLSLSLGTVAILVFTIAQRQLPTISLTLAFTFGAYGYVKKKTVLNPVIGMGLETLWLLIPALFVLFGQGTISLFFITPLQTVLLFFAGVTSLIPLLLFAVAAKRIPMYLMGLFLYITPMLNFLVAWLVFHERKTPVEMIAFVLVWVALLLVSTGHLWERKYKTVG